jgi:hypothetical protein
MEASKAVWALVASTIITCQLFIFWEQSATLSSLARQNTQKDFFFEA